MLLKLLLNFWQSITGKNTFCVEKCCRVSMRRTWLERQWEWFEIREQDRLLKATLAMQYPVSGEQNPFVSWPRPHQTNQEKSVIELEESVYWKEYWGSAMASWSRKDAGTEQTYSGKEKQQRCTDDSKVNGKWTCMNCKVNSVNNFDSFI